jgi:hypothetical protein
MMNEQVINIFSYILANFGTILFSRSSLYDGQHLERIENQDQTTIISKNLTLNETH